MPQKNSDQFEQLGTKIDPAMAEVLNAVCDSLQVDIYHLLQWFCYTLIRAAAPMHRLDPRIQKLMTMMESDAGWQHAFNLANRSRLRIAQCIIILEQDNRRGLGAVMVDKPFMSEARQTECVDDILERVAEVTMPGVYRRLRMMGAKMGCQNLMDVLLTLIDAQTIIDLDEADRAEGPQMGDRADNGRPYAYGKRTKAKQRRTVDGEARRQQRIQSADTESISTDNDTARDLEEETGFKPFGSEW